MKRLAVIGIVGTIALVIAQMVSAYNTSNYRSEMYQLCASEKRTIFGPDADIPRLCAWTKDLK